jgi:hypothetical protein
MAKALQCPACRSSHPLSDLPDASTFRCSGCGRALKVPAQVRPATARAGASPRSGRPDRTASLARKPAPATAAAAGGVAAPPAPPPLTPPPRSRRGRGPAPPRRRPAWPFRLIAWLIALPIGLVAVVVPARTYGFLSGQRLLDVLVGTGWTRYWRVLLIAPAWALVTAVLVQLILAGMRKLGDRRRAVRGQRESLAAEPGGNSSGGRRARRAGRADGRRAAS